MKRTPVVEWVAGACASGLIAFVSSALRAQAPAPEAPAPTTAADQGRGDRGSIGPELFPLFDANQDGSVTSAEIKATFDKWYADADMSKSGLVSQQQLGAALNAALGEPAPDANAATAAAAAGARRGAGGGGARTDSAAPIVWGTSPPDLTAPCGGRSQQPTVPCDTDYQAMLKALPASAPARPSKARKILIWSRLPSAGYQHSSIPLAAKAIEEMGKKTGAWTSDTAWDPGVFTADNLKQYDAIFLSNTTGCFLDEATDVSLTMARRKALVDFVRGGKGLAGIHATGDSYHGAGGCVNTDAAGGRAGGGRAGVGAAAGSGFARAGAAPGPGGTLAGVILRWSWGLNDKKVVANDLTLTNADMDQVADAWYRTLDAEEAGGVSQANFDTRIVGMVSTTAGTAPHVGRAGRDSGRGTWPDYNTMIGGFFKFHWYDPQEITFKIDDAKSPLTAMFGGQEFTVQDETYTFSINSFSRQNVHVLTSIDYDKMSFTDKLKEDNPRADHDYGLSWIKKDGQGRVFYMALGHDERIYAIPQMMAHLMAGMQYAVGDLKADDSPSVKAKKPEK